MNNRYTVAAAASHIALCQACQQELLARGGLLPAIPVRQPGHPRPDDTSPGDGGTIREFPDQPRDLRQGISPPRPTLR